MDHYDEFDDGTMPANVAELKDAVVGHKIVSANLSKVKGYWGGQVDALVITLDNGREVTLKDTDDCCAFTRLEAFLLNVERIDHVITGVTASDDYETWHVFADMGDVLELTVGWSPGNPFYYGYGFNIEVRDIDV